MKTLLVFVVFLLSPVFSQEIQIPSANGWFLSYTPPSSSNMDVDTSQTKSTLKDGFQVFRNRGKKVEGLNFVQFGWLKYLTSPTPDSIFVDVFFNNKDTSIKGVWVGIALEDSVHYFYLLKPLFLDAPFWYQVSWDVREAKATIKSFTKIGLMFFLVTDDSTYVSADVQVDNLRGIDGALGTVIYDDFSGSSTTGVSEDEQTPQGFALGQNYPNPFNPSTTIGFTIPEREHVSLVVFSSLGQEVRTLVNGEKEKGNHEVRFDASNLPSGIYFYRLRVGSFVETKRLVLLK